MRASLSSQQSRPRNSVLLDAPLRDRSGVPDDAALLNEWFLVLRGDGKSPDTLEGYGRSLKQLSSFLAAGGFPPLALATAEHLREWLNAMRDKGNKPATVNTRYRAVHRFYE